jgi:hypothetical protein
MKYCVTCESGVLRQGGKFCFECGGGLVEVPLRVWV